MAKRRRRKSLAGSPEEHGQAAYTAAYHSTGALREAEAAAKRGACEWALEAYELGAVQHGILRAEWEWSKKPDDFGALRAYSADLRATRKAVVRACLRGRK